jgi:ribosomal protein L21
MYAVIASGGKQEKVAEGQLVRVELLEGEQGSEIALAPVLVVDGDTVLATADQLEKATVKGIGPKARLNPTSSSQNCTLPLASPSLRPKTFGHQ